MILPSTPTGSPIYAMMLLVGIAWGAVYWFRESKKDGRVALIYAAGLAGAFAGDCGGGGLSAEKLHSLPASRAGAAGFTTNPKS